MFDLRELYQELILEHSKRPRHAGKPAGANCRVEGSNPLCGDQVRGHGLPGDIVPVRITHAQRATVEGGVEDGHITVATVREEDSPTGARWRWGREDVHESTRNAYA